MRNRIGFWRIASLIPVGIRTCVKADISQWQALSINLGGCIAVSGVSGIGGTRQQGDENSARRAAQTPKCIRLRPSLLLSAFLILIDAEISRKRART
eukprot:578002-Pleurochrysis_carterae.AAC.1